MVTKQSVWALFTGVLLMAAQPGLVSAEPHEPVVVEKEGGSAISEQPVGCDFSQMNLRIIFLNGQLVMPLSVSTFESWCAEQSRINCLVQIEMIGALSRQPCWFDRIVISETRSGESDVFAPYLELRIHALAGERVLNTSMVYSGGDYDHDSAQSRAHNVLARLRRALRGEAVPGVEVGTADRPIEAALPALLFEDGDKQAAVR